MDVRVIAYNLRKMADELEGSEMRDPKVVKANLNDE